eukprot:s1460_g5.t1
MTKSCYVRRFGSNRQDHRDTACYVAEKPGAVEAAFSEKSDTTQFLRTLRLQPSKRLKFRLRCRAVRLMRRVRLLPFIALLAWNLWSMFSQTRWSITEATATASIADALLRRGGRRFFTKRFRDARQGDDDDEDRRRKRLHRVSRRRGGHRLRSRRRH